MKQNKIMKYVGKQIDLENNALSEVTWIQKYKHCIFLLDCSSQIHIYRYEYATCSNLRKHEPIKVLLG